MPDLSTNLSLPYIQPSQAQKHVTHNESIQMLDTLVHLTVLTKDQPAPPANPNDGDRYVLPASPTGIWAGHANELAVYQETVWMFYPPSTGWIAWVDDLDAQWVFDGSTWAVVIGPVDFQNLDHVGIATTADATNRLAVASAASLFTHAGAGHQMKLNKAGAGDSASLLFQSGWSGKAEIGLTGDDDFHFKVSPDGLAWSDAITLDKNNGHMAIAGISGHVPIYNTGNSVFIGEGAGAADDLSDNQNVFIGYRAGYVNTAGAGNTAVGFQSLNANTTGANNTAVGLFALNSNSTGASNTAQGYYALGATTTGNNNNALGYAALRSNTIGNHNAAIGFAALYANTSGTFNAACGHYALRYTVAGGNNETNTNCAGLGNDTRVSGSNQVQLGNSATTTYAYGAVQNRSDTRDKTDIRDTVLGLKFINQLRPVDFRWDMREDYIDAVETIDKKSGELTTTVTKATRDGSRKRNRFHHGLIAQDVAKIIADTGIDFGGFQDHARSGGDDVLSVGYSELIGPLVKAVQELSAQVKILRTQIKN